MGYVEIAQPAARHVGRTRDPGGGRHPGNPDRAHEAAEVKQIRLHDIHTAMLDHPAEAPQAAFLLAAGDGNRQRVGDLLGFVVEIERYGLLEEREAMLEHETPDA